LDMRLASSSGSRSESGDNKYLIVSDRDEKIQVSAYPHCFNIVTFCLGHRQFVPSIEILANVENRLLSVSGDGCLKLWDLTNGKCLSTFDAWNAAAKVNKIQPFDNYKIKNNLPPLKKVLTFGETIVILYARVPYIHVLKCQADTLVDCGGIFTEEAVWDAALLHNHRVCVLTPEVSIFDLDLTKGEHSKVTESGSEVELELNRALESLRGAKEEESELDSMYKQWFDNVDEYHDRKRKRELEKLSKKQKIQPKSTEGDSRHADDM